MLKIIWIISFLPLSLFSYKLKLTKEDIEYIENSKNKSQIVKRIKNYQELKNKVKNFPLAKKLYYVNSFLNKILPNEDTKLYNKADYWATPKEFLINGGGDCEDYAIAKYFTLLDLGVNKKNMYFANVDVRGNKTPHMVLLYGKSKNRPKVVLDNLSSKIIPLDNRTKLLPKFAFNEIKSYDFKKKIFNKPIKIHWGKKNKFSDLLKKVYILNK